MKSYLSHLECSHCDKTYEANQLQQLCTCGKPLLARYDLASLKEALSPDDLVGREASLWRYRELLPVQREENIVSQGEGFTPLVSCEKTGTHIGIPNLYIKDEGIIPTGTFKARGAAVA